MIIRLSVIILILFIPYASFGNNAFDVELCRRNNKEGNDEALVAYLKGIKNNLVTATDQVFFHYYSALYARYTDNHKDRLNHLSRGLTIGAKNNISNQTLALFHDEYAILYRYNLQDKAHEHINKSISYKQEFDDPYQLARSYVIKANIFFGRSEEFRSKDSARLYYLKAAELNKDENLNYTIKNNLATLYSKDYLATLYGKEYQDSFDIAGAFHEVMAFEIKKNWCKKLNRTILNLAAHYHDFGLFDKAEPILDTILNHTIRNNWEAHLPFVYRLQIESFREQNDYKQLSIAQDSLANWNVRQNDIKIQTLLDEHERTISMSEEQAQIYKNRLWISILGGTSGSLLLFLLGYNRYNRIKRAAIEQELEKTKIQSAFNNTKAKMEGEQKERQTIAAVLHDQVASLLTAAGLHLKVASKTNETTSYRKVEQILEDVNIKVRDLSHQLISPALMKFGLSAAISSLVEKTENVNLEINLDSRIGKRRYEQTTETFVYNAVSELLQNSIKHSNATSCKVSLEESTTDLVISLSDDGTNGTIYPIKYGHGLTHINSRAEALGGLFSFHLDNTGASAELRIPLS